MPDELQVPSLPWNLEYLWGYFAELSKRWRANSGFGAQPINEEVISRWEAAKGIKLNSWEVRALLAADDAYMEFQAEAAKIRSKGSS